jgi:hypothetical protein
LRISNEKRIRARREAKGQRRGETRNLVNHENATASLQDRVRSREARETAANDNHLSHLLNMHSVKKNANREGRGQRGSGTEVRSKVEEFRRGSGEITIMTSKQT